MPELTPEQKKKLEKLARFANIADNKEVGIVQEISKVEDIAIEAKEIAEQALAKEPEKGDMGEKGEKGDKGDTGKDGKDGKDGKNGKDGLDGQDGKDGDIKDLSPEEVRDSLETLEGEERLDAKAIKNLPEVTRELGAKAGWGAHPLKILDDGVVIDKVARTINFTGGTVSRSPDGVITVSQTGSVSSVSNSDTTLTISPTTGAVVASLNLSKANTWLADQSVPDEVYGAGWNGSTEVPTKNALYDKIESIVASPGGSNTQVQFNDGGAFGGDAGLTYNKTTDELTAGSFYGSGVSIYDLNASNVTSGSLPTTFGGTGQISWTQGDIPYYSIGASLSKLAKDTNATRYLSNQGGLNNPSWNQVNLANGVTGTLPVANGGTNASTFTQGSVVFAGASGTYTQNNTNLFWDDSNNRLGIGTAAPATTLHIIKTTEQLRIGYDTSNYWRFTVASSGTMSVVPTTSNTAAWTFFQTDAASTLLTLDTMNNRVGIGGATPLGRLHVYGAASDKGIVVRNNITTPGIPFEIQNSSGTGLSAFDTSGNLGIGTITPSSVSGRYIEVYEASSAGYSCRNSARQWSFFVQSATGNYAVYNHSTATYGLYIDGTNLCSNGVNAPVAGEQWNITSRLSTNKTLVIKGASSQSATLLAFQNSAGSTLSVFDSNGYLAVGGSVLNTVSPRAYATSIAYTATAITENAATFKSLTNFTNTAAMNTYGWSGTYSRMYKTGSGTTDYIEAFGGQIETATGAGTIATAKAMYFVMQYYSNVTTSRGVDLYSYIDTGDTVTTHTGIYIRNMAGSGTCTTQYGIYIEDLTTGTTDYAIRALGGQCVFNDSGGDNDFRVEGDTDANLLFVDASTDRVGVGLSAPLAKLHSQATTEQLRLSYDAANYYKTVVGSTGAVSFDAVGAGKSFTFNEDSADSDFRVESNDNTHMIFVDASANKVGINQAAPAYTLDVNGDINVPSGSEYHHNSVAGYSGTFLIPSGETVTVSGGIITNVAF